MSTEKKELTILQTTFNSVVSIYREENDIKEYFAKYEQLKSSEEPLKEYLKTKKVNNLRGIIQQFGKWSDNRDKKADHINSIYNHLESFFYIGRLLSWSFGEDMNEEKEKMIAGTTAEVLAKFYADRKAEAEANKKALSNPETLEEFRKFMSEHGKEALTDEQKEAHQKLLADTQIKNNERREEAANTVAKVESKAVDFKLHPTKHSKTGEDIYTVIMTERVAPEIFKELRIKAKPFGGYYSRFTNKNANPPILAGFNFSNEEDARQFMGLTEESQNTTERKGERAEEVKSSTADKMRERAKTMRERAEKSMNQDRQTNTSKRAREAGYAEEKAQAEISFSKKLERIADGLENGSINYLEKIRNGKQLEQLQSILIRGYYERVPYSERNSIERNYKLDVNFVKYPTPCFSVDVLRSVFGSYEDTAGMKQGIKNIYKAADKGQNENGYFITNGTYIIDLIKTTANKIKGDKWAQERLLETIRDYERLQKMGITSLAILQMSLRELGELSEGTGMSEEAKKAKELKELERSFIGKKISGFFPTPKPLIEKMFSMAKVFEGETILEPSAGLGHIAEEIRTAYPQNDLSLIEFNYDLSKVLEAKGFNVEHENFLGTSHKYDVIFMNPPFEKHQDIDHVKHAFNLLKDGGRIVAIMAGNKNGQGSEVTKFREFVEEFGYMEENEAGSFKSAFNSTGVSTVTVYLEKPEGDTQEDETEEEETQAPETTEEAVIQAKSSEGEQMSFF